ncbi:MAG: hypothetical protein SV775_18820 [Thermodesulfobacteriota bacterium]|nr:hypothetical protein [Thermodesulfobacteriota bacterium]
MRKREILLFFPVLLLISFACTLPFTRNDSEEALNKRVQRLWEARVKGDGGTIYDMSDKKFRKSIPRERCLNRGTLNVIKYNIVKVEVVEKGREGSAMVFFETIRMGHRLEISIKEMWIFEDGKWHLKRSDLRTPFGDKR